MKILILLLLSVGLSACQDKQVERRYHQYTKKDHAVSMDMSDPHAGLGIPPVMVDGKDPHAGLGIPPVMVDGKDPHAGLGIPPVMADGKDPHAGLGIPPVMADGKDPHAGLNIPGMMAMDMSANMPTANDQMQQILSWVTPKGWGEKGASSMRLATFFNENNPTAIDCSIVSLAGMAGGLEGNISRWLTQISLSLSPDEIQDFIKTSNDQIFDFTRLQQGESPMANSMMAAVLEIKGNRVFVKMTGSLDAINQNRQQFIDLVKSIKSK